MQQKRQIRGKDESGYIDRVVGRGVEALVVFCARRRTAAKEIAPKAALPLARRGGTPPREAGNAPKPPLVAKAPATTRGQIKGGGLSGQLPKRRGLGGLAPHWPLWA